MLLEAIERERDGRDSHQRYHQQADSYPIAALVFSSYDKEFKHT